MLQARADGRGADDLSVVQGRQGSDLSGDAEPHVGVGGKGDGLHLTVGGHAIRGGPEVIDVRHPSRQSNSLTYVDKVLTAFRPILRRTVAGKELTLIGIS